MDSKQQRRVALITRVESGRLPKEEAAQLLGVSRWQLDNILRRCRDEGAKSVVHGNTGRSPVHKTPLVTVETVLRLAREGGPYDDLSVPHLRLYLAREHGLHLTRPTLDRLLRQAGVRLTRRRKRPVTRKRRPRSPAKGMLVPIDASPHAWLEDRGPSLTLLGAIDDATGKVLYLSFQPTEALHGYFHTDLIPRHNSEFARTPADPNPAGTPVERTMDLDHYLSERHTRVVRPDHTLFWKGHTLQLLQLHAHSVRPGAKITVYRTPTTSSSPTRGRRSCQTRTSAPARPDRTLPVS